MDSLPSKQMLWENTPQEEEKGISWHELDSFKFNDETHLIKHAFKICSLCVSVSHFDNSCDISNFFIIIISAMVICNQCSLMLLFSKRLQPTEGSADGSCFLAINYFKIKVCTFFWLLHT